MAVWALGEQTLSRTPGPLKATESTPQATPAISASSRPCRQGEGNAVQPSPLTGLVSGIIGTQVSTTSAGRLIPLNIELQCGAHQESRVPEGAAAIRSVVLLEQVLTAGMQAPDSSGGLARSRGDRVCGDNRSIAPLHPVPGRSTAEGGVPTPVLPFVKLLGEAESVSLDRPGQYRKAELSAERLCQRSYQNKSVRRPGGKQ
ncbi:hypothetical protein NDU88_005335 [Pleurodeles waltl]|uniref:Uncharacterized protein n=1 Tax=Pleurodeles waltl TaxID=8319 RepID=A0AAV7PGL1_PLEWA|nr:hypothetical protein NDU88_005333 [Pleurodeles waltl]KAJ1126929.1 hypothetical protein NDU88_005335 [Pleurodeles waltl]